MSEKSEIKRDQAKAQNNSGRGQFAKGDAKWQGFLVDYKETNRSFTLNKEVWGKICTDAFRVDRDLSPILKIIMGEGSGKVRLGIMEWEWIEELVKFWNENHD